MTNLNLRDLNSILVLAEDLHFGRSAERLGIAQPHLSEIVRRMEDATKVRLFLRRPRVRLTPAGEIIVESFRRVLADLEREIDHAQAVASGKMGTVRLGFSETAKLTELPFALKRFCDLHPEVTLSIVEGNSAQLWEMLEGGKLDLSVSREIRHDTPIQSVSIIEASLQLILPAEHPLLVYDQIPLEALADQPFILARRATDPSYYDRIMQSFHERGLTLKVSQVADSPTLMFALVRAGFGVSLELAHASKFTIPGIAFRSLREPILDVIIWLSYSPELSPSAELLRRFLAENADIARH